MDNILKLSDKRLERFHKRKRGSGTFNVFSSELPALHIIPFNEYNRQFPGRIPPSTTHTTLGRKRKHDARSPLVNKENRRTSSVVHPKDTDVPAKKHDVREHEHVIAGHNHVDMAVEHKTNAKPTDTIDYYQDDFVVHDHDNGMAVVADDNASENTPVVVHDSDDGLPRNNVHDVNGAVEEDEDTSSKNRTMAADNESGFSRYDNDDMEMEDKRSKKPTYDDDLSRADNGDIATKDEHGKPIYRVDDHFGPVRYDNNDLTVEAKKNEKRTLSDDSDNVAAPNDNTSKSPAQVDVDVNVDNNNFDYDVDYDDGFVGDDSGDVQVQKEDDISDPAQQQQQAAAPDGGKPQKDAGIDYNEHRSVISSTSKDSSQKVIEGYLNPQRRRQRRHMATVLMESLADQGVPLADIEKDNVKRRLMASLDAFAAPLKKDKSVSASLELVTDTIQTSVTKATNIQDETVQEYLQQFARNAVNQIEELRECHAQNRRLNGKVRRVRFLKNTSRTRMLDAEKTFRDIQTEIEYKEEARRKLREEIETFNGLKSFFDALDSTS